MKTNAIEFIVQISRFKFNIKYAKCELDNESNEMLSAIEMRADGVIPNIVKSPKNNDKILRMLNGNISNGGYNRVQDNNYHISNVKKQVCVI